MLAVELNSFDEVLKVCQLCLQDGLIIDWFLFANNCIRLVPPLIITNEQIEKAISIILSNLNKL